MPLRRLLCATTLLAIFSAGPAAARDTEHFFSIDDALTTENARAKMLDVMFFFRGQEGPPGGPPLLEVTTHQSAPALFRSDETACRIALLKAVIALQKRAQEHPDAAAVMDVISYTRDVPTESATEFRCVAGTTVAHVGLRGQLVKLK